MPQIYANNIGSVLTAPVTTGFTSLSIDGGDAVNFPSPSGSDFFLATLFSLDVNGREDRWEVVKVTARNTTTLTVERAQEGTSAFAWDSGTRIELRLTKGTLERYETAYSWGNHSGAGYLTTVNQAAVTAHQAALAIAWGQLTGVPAVFTPAAHTHVKAEITDFNDADYAAASHSHSFSSLTGKPTTLAGYGITNAVETSSAATLASVALGSWVITQSGSNLIFSYGGTERLRLSSTGELSAEGNVRGGVAL